ncbi:TonB-dependent receptor domain-containing protein [Derxia lacustris]|uniref:TonB-dependent receptor domain-containing protein n=1 Tax=Derxia lacustris TaxID=764842 RepID=UPI000A1740D7|nr:TonB-dependent receptor [Derxia lacustris]
MTFPCGRAIASLPALAALFVAHSQSVQAQTARLAEVVVTASRASQPLAEVVADMTVIDQTTIENSGAAAVADLLARVPGIEIARNGGPGATTSVFVRGGESRFTAVFVDGVRIDSQSTGGANWESIPLARIERIEVLRGPAAAIYGSDAIAGVIQIFTRRGEGAFAPVLTAGVGNHDSARVEASARQGGELLDWAAGLGRSTSEGFSARSGARANPDRDGAWSSSANARVGLRPAAGQRLEASLLWNSLDAQYDSSRTADDRSRQRLLTTGLDWSARWADGWSTHASASESHSRYQTAPSVYSTETRLRNYLLDNAWQSGAQRANFALERREDQLDNSSISPSRNDRSQNAAIAGYGYSEGAHVLQLNARRDDDSEFGAKTNGAIAYANSFAANWRASASFGTAFRAPTLYQRFSEYGDASLRPEVSRNLELGLRHRRGSDEIGLVAYRNRLSNLIAFVGSGSCASEFGCYANTARAEVEGATLSGATRLAELNLTGSLDWQLPRDSDTGLLLRRRARLHGNVAADTRFADWTLGASVQASGKRWDDAANRQALGGYALLGLHARTALTRELSLLLRADNLADKAYETALGYATGGRLLYAGLTWAPR